MQVRVEAVAAHCERARQADARILTEPKDHIYGERQYNAEDFYGHRWDFTETLVDVDPRAEAASRSTSQRPQHTQAALFGS